MHVTRENEYWIGMEADSGQWKWQDGTIEDNTFYWKTGQPPASPDKCVEVNGDTWEAVPCAGMTKPHICQHHGMLL